jgi:hypothetical protein
MALENDGSASSSTASIMRMVEDAAEKHCMESKDPAFMAAERRGVLARMGGAWQ